MASGVYHEEVATLQDSEDRKEIPWKKMVMPYWCFSNSSLVEQVSGRPEACGCFPSSVRPQLRVSLLCPSWPLLQHTSSLWDWHIWMNGRWRKLERGQRCSASGKQLSSQGTEQPPFFGLSMCRQPRLRTIYFQIIAVLLNKSSISNILLLFLISEKS